MYEVLLLHLLFHPWVYKYFQNDIKKNHTHNNMTVYFHELMHHIHL